MCVKIYIYLNIYLYMYIYMLYLHYNILQLIPDNIINYDYNPT